VSRGATVGVNVRREATVPPVPPALPVLTGRAAATLFLAFAFAYFFSALLRAVTATLAPSFSAELQLNAGDLGLLAGAYFLGFAALQLPLGRALDRFGPKRVLLSFMAVAVLACIAFALARGFGALLLARALIGVGVSACLMAPLTSFRHRLAPAAQMRANSWMLMTGSLGMLASTLPVQWLLPLLGWRGLFWAVAASLALAMAVIAVAVRADAPSRRAGPEPATRAPPDGGYRAIFAHPTFARLLPLGLVNYGGMIAVQSLWAGPWLTDVVGLAPAGAARGLFVINLCMLCTFLAWGMVMPSLLHRGWPAQRLIAAGVPVSLAVLAAIVALGSAAGAPMWAAWCVASTFISLSQPAVGQAFPAALAGRALSAYNLVIFAGVFVVQWGVGLAVDALVAGGFTRVQAFRAAFGGFWVLCAAAYAWFLWRPARTVNTSECA
jgi:MFS family permease